MDRQQDKPIYTSRSSEPEGGTMETETPAIKRHRFHAGFGDTSGANETPDPVEVLLHQRDKRR